MGAKLDEHAMVEAGRKLAAVLAQKEHEERRFKEATKGYKVIVDRLDAAAYALRRLLDTGEEPDEQLPLPEPPAEGEAELAPGSGIVAPEVMDTFGKGAGEQPEGEELELPLDEEPSGSEDGVEPTPPDPYNEGREDRRKGVTAMMNPYPINERALRREWLRGWNDADFEAEGGDERTPDPM